MGGACCDHGPSELPEDPKPAAAFRRVLWIALGLNLLMGAVEVGAGHRSGSLALFADAIDFFGDSANYALSLAVLAHGLGARARAAIVKAACMGGFGLAILGAAAWRAFEGAPPEAPVMGAVGLLALAVNVGVALLLVSHRTGDANRRSAWLCSRNDAIGNLAVVGAALAVGATGARWPDLLVAAGMAGLALTSAVSVLRQARGELARKPAPLPAE